MSVELASAEDVQAALDAKSKTKAEKGPSKRQLRKEATAAAKAAKAEAAASEDSDDSGDEGDYTLSPSATVSFGVDKDGKAYGPDNVPYRPDSKRAERFALVHDGATVDELGKAGLTPRRIRDMAKSGFITITHPDTSNTTGPIADPVAATETVMGLGGETEEDDAA